MMNSLKSELIIDVKGTKRWYLPRPDKPLLHREDGPAIEYPDGYKAWYRFGEEHNEFGPAIIWNYPDGRKPFERWSLFGVRLEGSLLTEYKQAVEDEDEEVRLAILAVLDIQKDPL